MDFVSSPRSTFFARSSTRMMRFTERRGFSSLRRRMSWTSSSEMARGLSASLRRFGCSAAKPSRR